MSFNKLLLAVASTILALSFMSGAAYSLPLSGTIKFPLSGSGSFAYDCAGVGPVGSSYTYDVDAKTFSANIGAMTCVFTLENGHTVTVPFNLNVTYNNANIEGTSPTNVTASCPAATYSGTFAATGACQGTTADCAAWSNQLPGGMFHFQNPWTSAPAGKIDGICAANFPAEDEFSEDLMASWSVTSGPGGTNATPALIRFCATPEDAQTGKLEPCTEIMGTGRNKFLYARGAAGTGIIRIIADAVAINTWNANNPQQGNLNILLSSNDDLDPHSIKDILPVGPDGPKLEGVLASSCNDNGGTITCHFPSSELAQKVEGKIVNGQVTLIGTAQTLGGTAVIFIVTANVSGGG